MRKSVDAHTAQFGGSRLLEKGRLFLAENARVAGQQYSRPKAVTSFDSVVTADSSLNQVNPPERFLPM